MVIGSSGRSHRGITSSKVSASRARGSSQGRPDIRLPDLRRAGDARLHIRPLPNRSRPGARWARRVPRSSAAPRQRLRHLVPRRPVHRRGTTSEGLFGPFVGWVRRPVGGKGGGKTSGPLPPRPSAHGRPNRQDPLALSGRRSAGRSCNWRIGHRLGRRVGQGHQPDLGPAPRRMRGATTSPLRRLTTLAGVAS